MILDPLLRNTLTTEADIDYQQTTHTVALVSFFIRTTGMAMALAFLAIGRVFICMAIEESDEHKVAIPYSLPSWAFAQGDWYGCI
jgi:hypothetical protein